MEAYLRAGADGAFTNVAVGGGAFTNYGTFIRLEGSGYGGAGWNIQGYDYIQLHRTAYYSGGSFPMVIYVTESRRTAAGSNTVSLPIIDRMSPLQGAFIFVSHPDLR